ncbi:MAG: ABC transporter ATP-binding protein [Eubacteriales bacterium]|nr:ABC transporter ATP-binding protein [Eubacteriales bacterium]
MSIIKVRNLKKVYNRGKESEVKALRGIDLSVEQGEMIAIMGPSGSGKSTLLHILGCLDTPTEGEYLFKDMRVGDLNNSQLSAIRNKNMGMVLQEFGLLLDVTAWENVSIPLLFDDTKVRDIKRLALNKLGDLNIEHLSLKKVSQLSGGERQRVAIARALINNPDVIFADEPTGSLDSKTADDIMQIFVDLNKRGITIIIVTHSQDVAERCGRTVKIFDGEIAQENKKDGAYNEVQSENR